MLSVIRSFKTVFKFLFHTHLLILLTVFMTIKVIKYVIKLVWAFIPSMLCIIYWLFFCTTRFIKDSFCFDLTNTVWIDSTTTKFLIFDLSFLSVSNSFLSSFYEMLCPFPRLLSYILIPTWFHTLYSTQHYQSWT